MYMPTKKYFRKKAKILCKMVQIVIESQSFLIYWQEPLNPRALHPEYIYIKVSHAPLITKKLNSIKNFLSKDK